MNRLFYLIGEPGAGKSTLLAKLTEPLIPSVKKQPFAHTYWWNDRAAVVELGERRPGGFGGTDSLSMSVQPKVVQWLQNAVWPVFGEGDRLANGKFFTSVTAMGWDLTVAFLDVPPELAAERRAKRAAELGTKAQNDQWVQGRRTKVLRLAEDWATMILKVDEGLASQEAAMAGLRSHPVFEILTLEPIEFRRR